MKKLPLGIQTFSELIKGNYVYVDKTKHIYDLTEGKYFFLSRPRRLGKNLLISTLREVFSGNRDLFKHLWIHDRIEWKKHPVIHIDFSNIQHANGSKEFNESIAFLLGNYAEKYKISLKATNIKQKFTELAEKLDEKYGKAVLLIDEYDKPIIDHIDNSAVALDNKEILGGFYEVIKSIDRHLRFVLITGVSKFSKVSIFSKLNNLVDITINDKFSQIAGYTQEERNSFFPNILIRYATLPAVPETLS